VQAGGDLLGDGDHLGTDLGIWLAVALLAGSLACLPELVGAGVVPRVIVEDFEAARSTPSEDNVGAMRTVLENAGVEFIDDIGVKLRKGGE
jgi:hypothetical protein